MYEDIIKFEDMVEDFNSFRNEHKDKNDPKVFNIYLVRTEHFSGTLRRQLGIDLERLGLAYCQKYDCWYWHQHLDVDFVLDIRDAKLVHKMIYKQKEWVDLG